MDDRTLESLQVALAASPENLRLRMLVVEACLGRGDEAAAFELIRRHAPEIREDSDRLLAARVCLAAGEADGALRYLTADTPESALLKARAFLALGRVSDAREAYRAAVAANPTLEDPDFAARLEARVVELRPGPDGEKRRLRVIERAPPDENELLVPETMTVTFEDVGGLSEIKEQIRKRIILPFQKPSLFRRFKKRVGGGILLYGPPGCGKTLLARATAGECGATFLNVAISDVLDMYVGESEAKLHALFEKARSSIPSVLFFDEVEAIGGKRQFARESATAKLVSQFLSEMDGFTRNNQGVLVLGATNVPWSVDPAFLRPGRFDRFLFVPPPDREAREVILRIHLSGRPASEGIDEGFLARHSSGFSGADLRNLVETAADGAIDESLSSGSEVPIRDDHLKAALREIRATTTEWLTTARNHARYANESGQYDEVLRFLERFGKS